MLSCSQPFEQNQPWVQCLGTLTESDGTGNINIVTCPTEFYTSSGYLRCNVNVSNVQDITTSNVDHFIFEVSSYNQVSGYMNNISGLNNITVQTQIDNQNSNNQGLDKELMGTIFWGSILLMVMGMGIGVTTQLMRRASNR